MNYSLIDADRNTHLKIVAVALMATAVLVVSLNVTGAGRHWIDLRYLTAAAPTVCHINLL